MSHNVQHQIAAIMRRRGGFSFGTALRLLEPYSPRLAYNFIDPTNSLFQGNTLTPVTAATNPVGLVIDQTQGGLTNLGAELVTNGSFATDTDWTKGTGWTISGGNAIKTAGSASNLSQLITLSAGKVYRISYTLVRNAGIFRPILTGGSLVNGVARNTSGTFTEIITAATGNTTFSISADSSADGTIDNVSVREIPGNHATASSDAKRPLFNEFTVNNRTVRGAVFDGSDDCLQVSGFDMSNTDEVTVIAGVRKLSDAARGVMVEHSATVSNNGTFNIEAPTSAASNYAFIAKGTAPVGYYGPTGFAAPITNWMSCVYDLGGAGLTTQIIPRINNTINQTGGSSTASGGNFINSTLNIGMRNNASLPFNGYIHYLFICGAIVPDEILTQIYRGLGPRIGLTV